ncbi:MAG TPA: MBL fold metallo-hydrolase [Candidatus Cybelea sp.]|nr:MBL fold metallo-hydrolase [Candidatus Cybelea sp.]
MPELTFVGAAGTVTGSKHLLSLDGHRAFVDCGLFQGTRDIEALNHEPLPVTPEELDAIALTHGHLDHVGYLPRIVRDGFRGPIYCTPPTEDVAAIVLEDAANLQSHLNDRGFHRERCHGLAPFFTSADVQQALSQIKTVPVETDFAFCGATARYHGVGHIIGAAYLGISFDGRKVIFSGDVGRYNTALLNDPTPLDGANTVVCEATYGDRKHPAESLAAFEKALVDGIERGGPILIPSFAVERSQDILFTIGSLQRSNPRIAQVPVHLDSPMAIKVDAVFARYGDAHKPMPGGADAPFGCRNLTLHVSTDESKAINDVTGSAIVIAASGMATGGRILHHLHRNLPNPRATVIFPGYLVHGTLGRMIADGVSPVRIFGDDLEVRATVEHLSGFSAHAGQDELLRWLGTLQSKPGCVYLVHAERSAANVFAEVLQDRLGINAVVAQRGVTVEV